MLADVLTAESDAIDELFNNPFEETNDSATVGKTSPSKKIYPITGKTVRNSKYEFVATGNLFHHVLAEIIMF